MPWTEISKWLSKILFQPYSNGGVTLICSKCGKEHPLEEMELTLSTTSGSRWPDDADGDVFRRMEASGFDFSKETDIDFNIDFDTWPPPIELLNTLRRQFKKVEMYLSGPTGTGYVLVVLHAQLTYDLVMFMQESLTELAAASGGICESWGVLQ